MKPRVLVTGATGHLGSYLMRELTGRQFDVTAWGHTATTTVGRISSVPVDLTDPERLTVAFRNARPHVVIHAGAMASVVECCGNPARAVAVNACGTSSLAGLCHAAGARLVYVSTDLVFDGARGCYSEVDRVAPTSVYGQTKVTGELAVLAESRNVVVRVSWMFGPSLNGRKNFFVEQVEALRGGPPKTLYRDEWRTPLALSTAARALIGIAMSDVSGVLHEGGPERMSRWEGGERLAAYRGTETTGLMCGHRPDGPGEPRPRDVALDSRRWRGLFPHEQWPTFEQALVEMGVR